MLFCVLIPDVRPNILSTSDLLGYWRLDGDLLDSAPAYNSATIGHHGTYTGELPVFTIGSDGLALDFTNAFGYYVRTGLAVNDGPKSLVLWVLSSLPIGADRTIWAGNEAGTGRRFYPGLYVRDGVWCPWLGGGDSNSRNLGFFNDPNDGQWHMYVLTDTGQGGVLTIYQDGIADPCFSLDYEGSTASIDPYLFVIGSGGGTGEPRYANAILDDVAMFNRILTIDEMALLYASGSLWAAVPEPSLSVLVLSTLAIVCVLIRRRRSRVGV
jgi:hypothetical protein